MFNFLYPGIQKFKHHFKMYFPDRHTIIGLEKYFLEYNFKFVFKKVLFRCQKILKSTFWNLIKKKYVTFILKSKKMIISIKWQINKVLMSILYHLNL